MAKLYFYYAKNPLQWLLSSRLNVVVNYEQSFTFKANVEKMVEVPSGNTIVQISAPYLGSEIGKVKEEFLVNEDDEVHITYKAPLLVFSSGTLFIEKGSKSDFKSHAVSDLLLTYLKIVLFTVVFMFILGFIYFQLINGVTKNNPVIINPNIQQENSEGNSDKESNTESKLTTNQDNAVRKANTYINTMAFSRDGLIKQLEYEGFNTEDSTFAVDYLNLDWSIQASYKANQYIDTMPFSKSGLIKQLEFEGFKSEEAQVGVDSLNIDWLKQAELKAKQYLKTMAFSRDALITQLEYEGFTNKEAVYGVESTGLK